MDSSRCKRNLLKRRKLDECTHLIDRAEAIKNNFSDLNWVLDKLNDGSVLQVCRAFGDYYLVYDCNVYGFLVYIDSYWTNSRRYSTKTKIRKCVSYETSCPPLRRP